MFKLQKNQEIMVIKIIIGSILSILIAQYLELEYSLSAGVIALLTIQSTKKATFKIAGKRIIAFLIMLLYVYLCFSILGYTLFSLAIFICLFTVSCFVLRIQDGLSICIVLMTHFYMQQSISNEWFRNATMLLLIGTGIGILLNLYMPKNIEMIRQHQKDIELYIKRILDAFSDYLVDCSKELALDNVFNNLEYQLKVALQDAYHEHDNLLYNDFTYYIEYLKLREQQMVTLRYMYSSMQLLSQLPSQAPILSSLLKNISNQLHEYNPADILLEELQKHTLDLQKDALPITRIEFEDRALLFNLLTQLEQFLILKKEFILSTKKYN